MVLYYYFVSGREERHPPRNIRTLVVFTKLLVPKYIDTNDDIIMF